MVDLGWSVMLLSIITPAFYVCICSYCTGWLTRGDLQQDQANHRGAVWPLHLDPILREALSFLPSPLHRCRAPLLPPRDPTRAQLAPLLMSFLQICFISSFSVIIMLLSKWKRSLITITVTVHTPLHEFLKKIIHSRLETPFQRNLSNEKAKREKRNKSFFVNWDGLKIRMFYRNLGRGEVAGKQTNRTEVEYFVNVHQVTFKTTRKMRSKDQWRVVFFLPLKRLDQTEPCWWYCWRSQLSCS